jgi:flagellar biosynthetic protein FliP
MNGPTTTQLLSKAVGASNELALASGGGSSAVKIFLILTALSFGTALVLSVTSFTRIVIVLSFLRQALGTPQMPPNQVLIGLSLFLTLFIMAPTARRVQEQAFQPLMDDKISLGEALQRAQGPLSDWMLKQTHEEDLRLFFEVSASARPARGEAVPFTVLVPAFMVSELGTAFRMGLFLFVPMLLIDLLVAVVLMSLGMMMVPPTMVALPLKLGVFLLAGGWHLVVSSLIRSF